MKSTLTFTKNKKKYISKEFDFEAMCCINDVAFRNQDAGELRMCAGAVDYMFDGTGAPDMAPATKARLCREVWLMYLEALTSKNEEAAEDE